MGFFTNNLSSFACYIIFFLHNSPSYFDYTIWFYQLYTNLLRWRDRCMNQNLRHMWQLHWKGICCPHIPSFARRFRHKNYIIRWIFSHILYLSFYFPTPISSAWIIVFCWLGICNCKNNRNQLLPLQIVFLEIVVHVGLIWIPEGSLCGMCWDRNIGMIGYGLGKM